MPQQKLGAPDAAKRAREQANEYDGVFAAEQLSLDDGSTIEIPPHPNLQMLDDERQEEYEELLFEIEGYDRHPDVYIPEQKLENGVVLPAETRRGGVMVPHRKDGELVKPPHTVRVVQAALGADVYAQLRAGGRNASDVWRIWNRQGLELADRQAADSKSDGSASGVEGVSH